MPKKNKFDAMEEELLRQEKHDQDIKLGFDLQDMLRTDAGAFLVKHWEQRIAIALKEGCLGKHPKGHPQAGEYMVLDYAAFCTVRGFCNGIQWVMGDIQSKINRAKRLELERRKAEKESSET